MLPKNVHKTENELCYFTDLHSFFFPNCKKRLKQLYIPSHMNSRSRLQCDFKHKCTCMGILKPYSLILKMFTLCLYVFVQIHLRKLF